MPSEIFLVGGGTIRVSEQPEAVQKSLGKERNGWVRLQTQGSDHDVWLRSEHVAGVVGVPDPGGRTVH